MKPLKTKLSGFLIIVLCASFSVPALAAAQNVDPTDSQYGTTLNQINQGADASGPSADTSDDGLSGNVGPLPFTGFDVIAMAAVALAVTGLGLALQRAVSRESSGLS